MRGGGERGLIRGVNAARGLGLVVLAAPAAVGILVAACATTDQSGQTFGPVFDVDAGTGASPRDGGGGEAGRTPLDDGGLPGDDGSTPPVDGGTCTGAMALLAGASGSLVGATWTAAGGWASAPITGGGAASAPSVVAVGTGFLGVVRGAADALLAVGAQPTFGVPGPVGAGATRSAPALVATTTGARVVYQAPDYKHAHAAWQGGAFGAVQTMGTGVDQSFGPSAPSAAALASGDVVVAWNGDFTADQERLLVRTLAGTTWSTTTPIAGSTTFPDASPAIVAVAGAPRDLVVVWVDKTTRYLTAASRDATSKAWSAGAAIAPPAALPTTNDAPHLAAVGPGAVVLAWRGQDEKPYVARGTVDAAGVTFAAPEPVVAGTNPVVFGAPSVAAAPCGEHAVLAYARDTGVEVVRLEAQGATAPEPVGGTSGARVVGVATRR